MRTNVNEISDHRRKWRFTLRDIFLIFTAVPFWVFVCYMIWVSPHTDRGLAPVVLVLLTVTIHRLTRTMKNAWSLAALLAGVIAAAGLVFAVFASG